jgi:hypothetical protein
MEIEMELLAVTRNSALEIRLLWVEEAATGERSAFELPLESHHVRNGGRSLTYV